MDKKHLNHIIKEEIYNKFDFLNTKTILKEREIDDLLTNIEFQKQFVIDVIKRNPNVKYEVVESRLTGDWDGTEYGKLTAEFSFEVKYDSPLADDEIKFEIYIEGRDVGYSMVNVPGTKGGWDDQPEPSYNYVRSVNWHEFDVEFSTVDGVVFNIDFLKKSKNWQIKSAFVKEMIKDIMEHDLEIEMSPRH